MNNEFANLETPTLTLDPFQEAPQVVHTMLAQEGLTEDGLKK